AVAVFEGAAGTVTLDGGFVTQPAAMLFLNSNYLINGVGTLSLPAGASVTVASGSDVTISPAVSADNLYANLPDGTLILNGDDNGITGNIALSGGVLQFGDGNGTSSTESIPE